MKENENPSAFPHVVYNQNGGHWEGRYEIYKQDGGMTLRDYFAAKALPSVISVHDEYIQQKVVKGGNGSLHELTAAICYEYADAMIAARKEAP